jgi:hypothetical protein
MRALRRAGVLALVGALACDRIVDPLPPTAEAFTPPVVFARWWGMVESCSGVAGNLADLQWFVVNGPLVNPSNSSEWVAGYYSLASNRIVLAPGASRDGWTVRHEMLHALLRVGGHPRSYFLGSCAGTVPCQGDCITDAGPFQPPADAIPVSMSALEVSSEIVPSAPSASFEDGFFTFTILVRNPLSHPVKISFPPRPYGGPPTDYPFEIHSSAGVMTGGDLLFDSSAVYFAAGETKRDVIDFAVLPDTAPGIHNVSAASSATGLGLGAYTLRGAYGSNWAKDLTVVMTR